MKNWAGNLEYSTTNIQYPETIEQLQALVKQSSKLKVIGSRHSFNRIADSDETLVSLEKMPRLLEIDHEQQQVTLSAQLKYGEFCNELHDAGYALHNLASLPHISVVGACMTATHGSGNENGNLATAVSALEMVTADGSLVTLFAQAQPDEFYGAVVSLGALGIITKMTLQLEPTFAVRQHVYHNLPFARLADQFDEIMSSAYSMSFFTTWQTDHIEVVLIKEKVTADLPTEPAPTFYDAILQPIDPPSAEDSTTPKGVAGPWQHRLPHFRMEATPSHGEELQAEYIVARHHAPAAIEAVRQLKAQISPVLLITEIRTIAADTLWMSPNYQQDSVGIHFTLKQDWPNVQKMLPLVEEALRPYKAQPHWGKLFTMPAAEIQATYKKLPDFQRLVKKHDPTGKFRNAFLNQYIFGQA